MESCRGAVHVRLHLRDGAVGGGSGSALAAGAAFGFLHPGWLSAPAGGGAPPPAPPAPGGDDRRVAAMALVLVLVVAALLLPFVAGLVPWLPRW